MTLFIIAGIIALICGFGQFFLLYLAITNILKKAILKGIIPVFVKVAVYGILTVLLLKAARNVLFVSLICYGAGFIISIVVYAVKSFKNL